MAVIENACFALGMILPIGAVARGRCASKILYAVHPLQRQAKLPLVNIAAHSFRKGLKVFLSIIVQRTVKVQKALLMLGQSAVPILHAEELIQRNIQKHAEPAQGLRIRQPLVCFPVADTILVYPHELCKLPLVVFCAGAIFADYIAKGIRGFRLSWGAR